MKTVTKKAYLFIIFISVVILVAVPAVSADEKAVQISTLPLSFIENVGQRDPSVLFHADAAGHAIFFTAEDVILARADPESSTQYCIVIGLAGSEPGVVKGIDQLSGKANFFVGNDPSEWNTAVPMYKGIVYEEVLPGVDLFFRGENGVLKREFVIAPAVDSRAIVMKYGGHESLTLDDMGHLLVATPTGILIETAPFAYQEINGRQVEVACRYLILDENEVGFVLGEYNGAYPVVIDPYLEYSTYFGGYGDEIGYGIAVDDTGCAYITGSTDSTSIVLPSHSVYQETLAGGKDAFITKLSSDGTELEFFTYIGGSDDDVGTGIAVHPEECGRPIITGYTYSDDFPVLDAYQSTKSNLSDAFVTFIDNDGDEILISTYYGGNGTDMAYGISSTGLFITGFTSSTDLPTTEGAFQTTLAGGTDVFVAAVLNVLYASTYLGGEGDDKGYAIEHYGDEVLVTGTTKSLVFNTTPWSFRRSLRGEQDAFVTRFDVDLSRLYYSTYLGGYGYDGGQGIAVDVDGNAYITGYTDSQSEPYTYTFPVLDAYQDTYGGSDPISSLHYGDAFVTKLNPDGSALDYSTYLGGRGNDVGFDIAVDETGCAYVTGWTNSPDFPTEDALQADLNGVKRDAFVSQLSADGSLLEFSTYFGGTYYDEGYGIHSTGAGNVTITGYTLSPYSFPLKNAYQSQLAGSPNIRKADAFISRIARIIPVASLTADPDRGFVPLTVDFTDTSSGDPISWDWDFGDGDTSDEQNPTHTYNAVSNYAVDLTVCNLDGCDVTSGTIYVGPNLIPDFSADVTEGCKNLTVNFTDLTTPSSGNGAPTDWSWDFGDGNVTNVTTGGYILHTYTDASDFNVTLSVTSFYGTNETRKFDYIIVNEEPCASIASNVTVGFAPLTVQFEDNSNSFPDTWEWRFGTGEGMSTDKDPIHTYTDPGDYWVNLTVENECGSNWTNITDYIRVAAPLTANFTANSTTGYRPFTVDFTDYSVFMDGVPTTWSWDFGDGNVTNLTTNASILHTYTTYGVFDVSLYISNMYGSDLLTRTDYITVAVLPDLYFVPDPPIPDTDPVIIPINDITPISMYLEIAEFGLSGYNVTVYFSDPAAADFTNVTFPAWAGTRSLDSSLPAPTMYVKAADTGDLVKPGDTDILMLSFDTTGRNVMNTTISITINKMNTDIGGDLITHVIPCEVWVVDLQPLPGESLTPTDPDGDQLYWDLNGNGNVDFADLILYFNYMWWIETYEPTMLFDYNGNGNIDFNDLVLLYNKVMA